MVDLCFDLSYIPLSTGKRNQIDYVIGVTGVVAIHFKLLAYVWVRKGRASLDVVAVCTIKAQKGARIIASLNGGLDDLCIWDNVCLYQFVTYIFSPLK